MSTNSHQIYHPVLATRHLYAVAIELGVPSFDILVGTQLRPIDLAESSRMISAEEEIIVLRNILMHYPDATKLGALTGQRFDVANLGLLGFAVTASATIRELIEITLRFFTLTMLHVSIVITENPDSVSLEFRSEHISPDIKKFFLTRDFIGIISTVTPFLAPLLTKYGSKITITTQLDKKIIEPLVRNLPINIHFGGYFNGAEFPIEMLDTPLPQADSLTVDACVTQCEEILQKLHSSEGIAAQVRLKFIENPSLAPCLDDVAQSLHLHSRTLRRRLAEENTSWRRISNEVRSALAVELLLQVGLSVEQVARRLGYSETSAFSRAFASWYGLSPREYRMQMT
ncbi:MAG: helix-turn-helix domain-containing protein [Mycobacteriaceae bacterium]